MAILTIKKEHTLPGAPIASWGSSSSVEISEFMEHMLNKGFMEGKFQIVRLPNGNLEMRLENS